MSCGAITTLALSAVLLGQQNLKVESRRDDAQITICAASDASNANAVVRLKDSAGRVVLSRKIRLSQMEFYDTPKRRGGYVAKKATVLVSYPQTEKTASAVTVELSSLDGTYSRSAKVPSIRVEPTMRFR